jgi:WD40 repeat protein
MLAIATTADKTHLIFEDRERGYIKLNSVQDETYGIPKMSFRRGDVGVHKCVVAILPLKDNKHFFVCSYATSSILKFSFVEKMVTEVRTQPEFKKVDKMILSGDERWLVFSTETKWLFKMDAGT